jgi:hypothetical protein
MTMELSRAAFLLESELEQLPGLPAWKRRELENVGRASIRAMREAAELIEQLERERSASQVAIFSHRQSG